MRLKLSILLFLFCGVEMMAHGGHMATFKYQIVANTITLEFKIENTVLHHFDLESTCAQYQTATAMCLVQHINSNTDFTIDDQKVDFELQSSKQDERFFHIEMIAKGTFSACEEMTIKNECFLEFDSKFENRIIIQKEDSEKSYRLDRKHPKIKIN